ncbi:(2Fe-2S) ferredoxin domain-containing protein [Paenibacillus durus]|uniref:Cobalamin biosynthesis protein CbiW n=1 Tax=Paenibacillus durus ATCC 35681 TaxID=1333534 RepID=A0A0F7FA62_PAEDU|nr:(2Fe-2S) ferredoxin domain-containing protein [Paenibacillus durus]AKG35477.1 cobalamin biosynthesis protein CbiW [Paenibacillus durus ATCC 35681]
MTTWNLQGTACHLLVCGGSSCKKRKSGEIAQAIKKEIEKQGGEALIHTTFTSCAGRCGNSPVVISYPEGVWYGDMSPKRVKLLVRKSLVGKRFKKNILYTFGKNGMTASAKEGMKGKKKGKK